MSQHGKKSNDIEPLLEITPNLMQNKNYSILVYPFTFGQFRIRLTNVKIKDSYAPEGHGSIIREMCTYKNATMIETVGKLMESKEPEKTAESFATPYNCEFPGGRIRLDNEPRNFEKPETD